MEKAILQFRCAVIQHMSTRGTEDLSMDLWKNVIKLLLQFVHYHCMMNLMNAAAFTPNEKRNYSCPTALEMMPQFLQQHTIHIHTIHYTKGSPTWKTFNCGKEVYCTYINKVPSLYHEVFDHPVNEQQQKQKNNLIKLTNHFPLVFLVKKGFNIEV